MMTWTLCPKCFKEIPAKVESLYMVKSCSCGYSDRVPVESDPIFYEQVGKISGSIPFDEELSLLDVTDRCNRFCEFCYYPVRESADPSISSILESARAIRAQGIRRFALTGGEPTVRTDLFEVIARLKREIPDCSVEILTNGKVLQDPEYLQELGAMVSMRSGQPFGEFTAIYVSVHEKIVLENIRRAGIKVGFLMWTIRSLRELPEIFDLVREYRDIYFQARIRAAAGHWATEKAPKKIYVSQMYKEALKYGAMAGVGAAPIIGVDNNYYRFNIDLDGCRVRLIRWPDAEDIDLSYHQCGPYYYSRSGRLVNFIYALLLNGGLDRGWLNGRKIHTVADDGG